MPSLVEPRATATPSRSGSVMVDRGPSLTWSLLMTLLVLALLLWSLAETRAYRGRPALLDVSPVGSIESAHKIARQKSLAQPTPVDVRAAARQEQEALRLRSRLVA